MPICCITSAQLSGCKKRLPATSPGTICATIAEAVVASRTGEAGPREVVDLTFDRVRREGGEALGFMDAAVRAMRDALDPIVEAIHDIVDELAWNVDAGAMREATLTGADGRLGDSLMGGP